MSKAKKCATCGRKLSGSNYHLMWDSRQKRVVPVCREPYDCQKPYITLQKKEA